MTERRRRLLAGLLSIGSRLVGAVLILLGRLVRSERIKTAGKRRFRSGAFERRWIPDLGERERHSTIVAERLGLDEAGRGVPVAEAARRLGVSPTTVRRRVQRGQLKGIHRGGRLTGVILDD
jgi:hypothetical protein